MGRAIAQTHTFSCREGYVRCEEAGCARLYPLPGRLRCHCGPAWRSARAHHEDCPAYRWRRRGSYWRRQTGLWGACVEYVMWLAVVTAAMRLLTWVLLGTAWLLERAS